jgi:2-polyprenyl-3-methyl-5-hydroxy-6-metoxy-1,4-benzoquinol methylase
MTLPSEKRSGFTRHNQEVIDYYDGRIKKTMTPRESNYLDHHVNRFLEFTGIKQGLRVLEVGCGMGRYTLPLAARGISVEGMDISQFLLDRLQDFNQRRFNIPLYCADVIDYPKELEGQFDAVVGFFTLHHMHDLDRCFSAMKALVKPGGQVVFLEPNAYNVLYYLQIIITPTMTWKGDGRMASMRPNVIFPALRNGGLFDFKLDRFGFFPPFITNTKIGYALELKLEKFPLWRGLLPAVIFSADRALEEA